MSKHIAFWVGIFGLITIALIPGCQFIQRTLSDPKIILPVVTLNRIEFVKDEQNSGFWFYAEDIAPTKGAKGNHGAPMALSFIFNITNPNKTPVLLNQINFAVKFGKYEMDIIQSKEKMWIPSDKTNQLRVNYFLNVQSARLNLVVQGTPNSIDKSGKIAVDKDQKKETDKENQKENWLWSTLHEYWTKIPESQSFVSVTDVCSNFEVNQVTVWVPEKDKKCPPMSNRQK